MTIRWIPPTRRWWWTGTTTPVRRAQVLQYCKFVGETVLYATENDPELRERGWYDHGKYPFVFDVLFPEEGTPCGYGYVDLCKSPQKQIDLMNQPFSRTRCGGDTKVFHPVRRSGDENEYADWTALYTTVNQANLVIRHVPAMGLKEKPRASAWGTPTSSARTASSRSHASGAMPRCRSGATNRPTRSCSSDAPPSRKC